MLGDDLRRELARELPDLHEKAQTDDEERHLFAELLSAAPRVVLSWERADEDGRERSASPRRSPNPSL